MNVYMVAEPHPDGIATAPEVEPRRNLDSSEGAAAPLLRPHRLVEL